jgi:hypothetical protein
VTTVPPLCRVAGLASAGLLGLGLLTGCGDGSEEPDAEETSASPVESEAVDPAAYLPAPDGVELTMPGTGVGLGESAVLAWEPRQGEVAVVELSVTRIDRTSIEESFQGWQVDDRTAAQTPYFAGVLVENLGETDLGRQPLPLYATDGGELLIEPTGFQGDFEPCPGGTLPNEFAPGDRERLCLVFLTEPTAELEGVAFLPAAGLEPITWSGEITSLERNVKKGTEKDSREKRPGGAAGGT